MPKVKTNRVKYPKGWELIEPTLRELQAKMREAENDPHDGKRKCEALWPIFKIAHQKSRYIFDLYHRRKEISNELYEFCLDQGYADRNLIAKWKKPLPPYCSGVHCSGEYCFGESDQMLADLDSETAGRHHTIVHVPPLPFIVADFAIFTGTLDLPPFCFRRPIRNPDPPSCSDSADRDTLRDSPPKSHPRSSTRHRRCCLLLCRFPPGYERLCCLKCMQPRDHNFQTTCVCRVPKNLREEKVIECVHCGCRGCASGD